MPPVSDLLYVFTPRTNNNTTTTATTSPQRNRTPIPSSTNPFESSPPSVSSSTFDTWGQREGTNYRHQSANHNHNRPQHPRTPVRYVREGEYDPEYEPNYYTRAEPQQQPSLQHEADNNNRRKNIHPGMWGTNHQRNTNQRHLEYGESLRTAPSDQELLLHHAHSPPDLITKEALDSSHSTSEVTPPSSAPAASEQPSSVTSTLSSSARQRDENYDYDDEEDVQEPSYLPISTLPHGVVKSAQQQQQLEERQPPLPPMSAAAAAEVALLDSFRKPSQRNRDGSLSSSSARRRQGQQPAQSNQQHYQREQRQTFEQHNNHNITVNSSLEDSHHTHTLSLHDLCGEATRTDDIAWRNALYLLSTQPHLAKIVTEEETWTPLHVSCLGVTPPPDFMVRALLYCDQAGARTVDAGGRLPLHILAASSADPVILSLLVNEHTASIYHRDQAKHGFTPLHLLLRNEEIDVTVEQVRILLGQCIPKASATIHEGPRRILQRRGEHLDLTLIDLEQIASTAPRSKQRKRGLPELDWEQYPEDVQVCFKRLAQWKKKQPKEEREALDDDEDADEHAVEVELTPSREERNPAAMATLTNQLLPLHMMVRRVLHPATNNNSRHSSLTELREQGSQQIDEEEEHPVFEPYQPPSTNVYEVLRVLIAANPRGLVTRDGQGRTPLLLALLDKDRQADLELIELLLGRSCSNATFQTSLPEWAFDLTFPNHAHQYGDGNPEEEGAVRFINPAMFATVEALQLPLHVAAEEMVGSIDAISTIHACYPGAIYVQDARGRTPLHIALSNYRRVLPPPSVISLLFTDRVARMRDHDGKLPFDLLVESSQTLSMLHSKRFSQDGDEMDLSIYGKLLAASIRHNPNMNGRASSSMSGRLLLRQLGQLPPWLRRQACRAELTQELIMEDLSSPGKCAGILLDGFVLGSLIATFRVQLNIMKDSWRAGLIYALASYLLVCQLVDWVSFLVRSEYRRLLNLGCWITISAVVLTIVTTYQTSRPHNKSLRDYEHITNLGSAATAMLWGSVVCYISSWWYGMATFMGTAAKTAYWMIWPLLALGTLVVGFAEILYTHYYPICKHGHAVAVPFLCDTRDAYRAVYYLLLGQPLEESSPGDLPGGTIVLIVLFTFLAVWILYSSLASLVGIVGQLNHTEIALTYFWDPKLSWMLTSRCSLLQTTALRCCPRKLLPRQTTWPPSPKLMLVRKPSLIESYCDSMETIWEEIVVINFSSGRRGTKELRWYTRFRGRQPLLMGLVSLVVVPMWLTFGLLTLGYLWPPQVRRWLFQPHVVRTNQVGSVHGNSAAQVSDVRNELRQLKNMTFEKTSNVQHDIQELKDLLLRAMAE